MPDINVEDITRFYNYLEHTNETELRVIDPHNRQPPISTHNKHLQSILKDIEKYNGKWNIYFGVNERNSTGTKKQDVIKIRHVFIDVDPIRETNTSATDKEKQDAHDTVKKIIWWCEQNNYSKPNIIDSGNGFNLYWRIPELEVNNGNLEKIDSQTKAFCRQMNEEFSNENVKIDQTGDLSRIMKVPGTLNIKGVNDPETPWRLSKIEHWDEKQEPSNNLLIHMLTLKTEETKPQIIVKKDIPKLPSIEKLKAKDSKLNRLLNGDTTGYQSRSEAEMALVVKLIQHNLPETQIKEIMDLDPIGKWGKATHNYRERTLDKAREFSSKHIEPIRQTGFQDVLDVFNKWLYIEDENDLYLLAGLFISHRILGDPVWMFLIGPSSDAKTEMLRAFDNEKETKLVQSMTPRTLISGFKPTDDFRELYDLAPRLRNKILMIYDFTEMLTKRKEDRNEMFSQLRGLYDGTVNRILGNGLDITYGRGTEEDPKIYCSLIAAATPAIDMYLLEQQILGPRHLSYRKATKDQNKIMSALDNPESIDRDMMRTDIRQTVQDYLGSVEITHTELDEEETKNLHEIVKTLAKLRTGGLFDRYTNELDDIMTPEAVPRIYVMLKKLYLGLKNIDTITTKRLNRIIKKVITSSVPETRLRVLALLYELPDEEEATTTIASILKLGNGTVKRQLVALHFLGYVSRRVERVENSKLQRDYWKITEAGFDEMMNFFSRDTILPEFSQTSA